MNITSLINNSKILATVGALACAGITCSANGATNTTSINFKALDQSLETQVCIMAATEGLDAAKKLVRKKDINFGLFNQSVSCNGKSIKSFAKTYFEEEAQQEISAQKVVAVRAKNSSIESQLCIDAVMLGEEQAREKHGLQGVNVLCNNQPLSVFVYNINKKDMLVKLAD